MSISISISILELLLLLTNFSFYVVRGLTSNYIILISTDLDYDWQEQSYFFIFFIIGYILSSISATIFGKKINSYFALICGLFLWILGNIGMGNGYKIYVSRFIIGFGDGIYQCIMPLVIRNNIPDNDTVLRRIYAISSMGVGFGNLISSLYDQWRHVYMGSVIIPLTAFMYLIIRCHALNVILPTNTNITSSIQKILKNRLWCLSTFGYMFGSMILSNMVIWIPTYLKSRYENTMDFTILMSSYSGITIVCSLGVVLCNNYLFNYLHRFYGLDLVYIGVNAMAYMIMLLCLQIYLELDRWYLFLIFHTIFMVANSLMSVCYSLIILRSIETEDSAGSVALSIIIVNLVGAILSPIVSSYINTITNSLNTTFHIIGMSFFLAALCNMIALYYETMHTRFVNLDDGMVSGTDQIELVIVK